MSDLFQAAGLTPEAPRPLADRLRPQTQDEGVGQDHLLGPEGPIRRMANARRLNTGSMYPVAGKAAWHWQDHHRPPAGQGGRL